MENSQPLGSQVGPRKRAPRWLRLLARLFLLWLALCATWLALAVTGYINVRGS